MTTLTPALTERNSRRRSYILEMRSDAASKTATNNQVDLNRHSRLSIHPDPAVRAQLRHTRRKHHEVGHRYTTLKKRIEALDLSKAADWTVFQGIAPYPNGDWWDLTTPLATAFRKFSTLPTVALTPAEEAEWAYETTAHEIHEAFETELHALIGSDVHFLGTTLITLTQDQIADLTELRSRRDAMLALTTLPADPFDPNHWGHDTALASLALTPTTGSGITLTPAFAAGIRSYTMNRRGNQVFRVDAVARDPKATVVVTKETYRVVVRVTSALGDVADYIVAGNSEAKLTSLAFGPSPGSNYPYTPAFDSETLAYVTTAPLAGILNVAGATSTPGAVVSHTKDGTGVNVVVTAADGVTTRTYRITSSHSG